MLKRKMIVQTACVIACMSALPAMADIFIQDVKHGTKSGVRFTFLSSGTNRTGGGNNGLFKIDGTINVDFTAGVMTLAAGLNKLDVFDKNGNTKLGTLQMTAANWTDSDQDGNLLGTFSFSLTADGPNALQTKINTNGSTATVGFKDIAYKSGLFNRFGIDAGIDPFNTYVNGGDFNNGIVGDLEVYGWGNQIITDDFGQPGGKPYSQRSKNWGLDWSSSGEGIGVIPAPGAVLLACLGLGLIGSNHRRRRQ